VTAEEHLGPAVVVNTDAAMVNPDWEVFAVEHERRFGLAISHLKSLVKGQRFDNEVMKVRVGAGGFYVQSKRFPAAFYGDTTRPTVRRIGAAEAEVIAWDAAAHYRAGEARSLTAIYGDDEPHDVFFGYRMVGARRYEIGMMRHRLPWHTRVVVEGAIGSELAPSGAGVVVLQRLAADRFVLITAPGRRPPFTGIVEPEG
jgi:hypothetical protein